MSIVLSVVLLSLIFSNVVSAKDSTLPQPIPITSEPIGIVIETTNQDDFNEVVNTIECGNKRAKQLWEVSELGGSYHNYVVTKYIEYYAKGAGRVYE